MSFIGKAIGKLTGADDAADAAAKAARTQAKAADAGIAEQRRQFDALQAAMRPWLDIGQSALGGAGDLAGLGAPGAQQAAIQALQASPQFQSLTQQGEEAILANASATGGLRGGNTQAALAQFRPQVLAQLIEQQYGRLGGLASMGQNAAAGVGNAGIQTGTNIAQLLQQQGAALAGGQIAQGSVAGQGFNTLAGLGGMFIGAGGLPGLKKLF